MSKKASVAQEFHHIGYATTSVEKERTYLRRLGYLQEGSEFKDPAQGIRGIFMSGSGPRIELLEPIEGSNVLTPWIESGIKMYHIAFLVDDLEKQLHQSRTQRARVVAVPVPAGAFSGRRIAFVLMQNLLLVEYIERTRSAHE